VEAESNPPVEKSVDRLAQPRAAVFEVFQKRSRCRCPKSTLTSRIAFNILYLRAAQAAGLAPPAHSGIRIMKKKLRVYQENVKTRHTAHWDWDYLTWQEIEDRLQKKKVAAHQPTNARAMSGHRRRSAHVILFVAGLLAFVALGLVIVSQFSGFGSSG